MHKERRLNRIIPNGARLFDWRAPDGWRLRRLDWPVPSGEPARGSLLFASGRGDFIEKYLEPMRHWHGRGWNVASFDWRSQGGSRGDIVGGHLDSLDPLVDDLAALMAEWSGASPGPHVAIGHSMGGHLLLRTLTEAKARVDAAVLVAPMLAINSAGVPGSWLWSLASTMTALGWGRQPAWPPGKSKGVEARRTGAVRQATLTSCPQRYADEAWWWRRRPGYDLGVPSWGWLAAAYRSCAALTEARMAALDVPVLLMGADRDRLVDAAAMRSAARVLPRAELTMFADSAHEILRETDPVRLAAYARIDAFLDRYAR